MRKLAKNAKFFAPEIFEKRDKPFLLILFQSRKAEVVWRMAALTIGKIIAAESPFIVMTTGAGLPVFGNQMHRRLRCRDLIASAGSGSDLMTAHAAEFVSGVTKIHTVGFCPFRRRAAFASGLVASTARRHFKRRLRRMTLKAERVRSEPGGN
jgi:hypothetical protein